jgi:6-phospho-beta-glucosidase
MAGCDVVLCQIRPGGMEARAGDEALAAEEGVPGDEGLGPSGLASFLRGRPVMDRIAEAWSRLAPAAAFLQLTSPLGLTVARLSRLAGRRALGVCELPATTSAALLARVGPRLGLERLSHAHFGLNHWAWLYDFRDERGVDRTAEVIEAAADGGDGIAGGSGDDGVDAAVARRERAVPVPYLRLYYHAERELARQRARPRPRGLELAAWAAELEAAYAAPGGPSAARVGELLGRRRMNWYEDGVVPALEAVCGGAPRGSGDGVELVLNVTSVEPGGIAVELPCRLSAGGAVAPRPQPPLPDGPAALFRRTAAYERAALALPDAPRVEDLARVLAAHPLVADEAQAARLARRLAGQGG